MIKRTHAKVARGLGGALLLALMVTGPVLLLLSCRPVRPRRPVVLPPAPATIDEPPLIAVHLARSHRALSAGCAGGGTWYGVSDGNRTLATGGIGPWRLGAAGGRLALDDEPQPWTKMELHPASGPFRLGARNYRGVLAIEAGPDGGLVAVNFVSPRDYLRGVVGSEMYQSWPLDALMAQAVAARTFMLYALRDKGYMGPRDMAYRGTAAESGSTDLAVELTAGAILTYGSRILPAYFHSTCGGHTAPVDKAFAEEPIPPLQGVPCEWCRQSPTYEWQADIAGYRISQALRQKGAGPVRAIAPVDAEPDGYARYVDVNGVLRLGANAFRSSVGSGTLKSARFRVEARDGRFLFQGNGHGHGVGLCQWGARGLAAAGRDWREILQYYYPGAVLSKIY